MPSNFKFSSTSIVRIPILDKSILKEIKSEKEILYWGEKLKEAIYVSSPPLYHALKKYDSLNSEKKAKMIETLYKFIIRAATRPTPYGLFSGCFSVPWSETGDKNQLSQNFNSFFSLDFRILMEIKMKYESLIVNNLKFIINNSAHIIDNRLKILSYDESSGRRNYSIVEYSLNQPLEFIISLCKENYLSINDIVSEFKKHEINEEEIRSFLTSLIESKILVSELEPFFNNTEYGYFLLSKIEDILEKKKDSEALYLKELKFLINTINNKFDIKLLTSIEECLKKILKIENFNHPFIKADLIELEKNKNINLKKDFKDSILTGIDLFSKITAQQPNPIIEKFKTEFVKHFQYKLVPLNYIFDEYHSFSLYNEEINTEENPLLNHIPFTIDSNYYRFPLESFFYNKVKQSIDLGYKNIEIKDHELKGLNNKQLDGNLYICYKIVDSEKKIIYIEYLGENAQSNFSRFIYGSENLSELLIELNNFDKQLEENLKYENYEIAHIPERIEACNIIDNLKVNKKTIPFLYHSKDTKRLNLEDIFVTIRDNKVVLFSKSLKKVIKPNMSSMIISNSVSSLPVYRFLNDLFKENSRSLNFSWSNYPSIINNFSYIPRITYKKILICPSIWKINIHDIKDILDSNYSIESINSFVENKKLPQYVLIKEHDNELLIDLNKKYSLQIFVKEVQKKGSIIIAEDMMLTSDYFQTNEKNPINAQVISFVSNLDSLDSKISENYRFYDDEELEVERIFPPYSEWFYIKIYCTPKGGDKIILKISELCNDLVENSIINSWFFIRFEDSDGFHIRLRLNLKNIRHFYEIWEKVNQSLHDLDFIFKTTIDSYNRELERYGSEFISIVETLFYYDSIFCAELLRITDDDNELRWICSMKSIDDLLDMFNLNINEKLEIMTELKEEFNTEFSVDASINRVITEKYRMSKERMLEVFSSEILTNILISRHNSFQENARFIKNKCTFFTSLIKSCIHMSMNRYLKQEHRKSEMVLYNFLHKYYLQKLHSK